MDKLIARLEIIELIQFLTKFAQRGNRHSVNIHHNTFGVSACCCCCCCDCISFTFLVCPAPQCRSKNFPVSRHFFNMRRLFFVIVSSFRRPIVRILSQRQGTEHQHRKKTRNKTFVFNAKVRRRATTKAGYWEMRYDGDEEMLIKLRDELNHATEGPRMATHWQSKTTHASGGAGTWTACRCVLLNRVLLVNF